MMSDETARAHVTVGFEASPERVFDAWLQPELVRQWLFVTDEDGSERAYVDARPGGQFILIDRRGDDVSAISGAYLEIERPSRLVLSLFAPAFSPLTTKVSVDLATAGSGCQLSLVAELGPDLATGREGLENGWRGFFERLRSLLETPSAA